MKNSANERTKHKTHLAVWLTSLILEKTKTKKQTIKKKKKAEDKSDITVFLSAHFGQGQ